VKKTIEPGTTGWQSFDIPIEALADSKTGSPSLQAVKAMLIGVESINDQPFRGIMYVNDLLLADADILIGDAAKFELTTAYKDLGGISLSTSKRDGTYSLIGENPKNIDNLDQKITLNFNPGRLLFGQKVSTVFRMQYSTDTSVNNNDIETSSNSTKGENYTNRFDFSSNINISKLPNITYSYSFSEKENTLTTDYSKYLQTNHSLGVAYTYPNIVYSSITLLPNKVSFSYSENNLNSEFLTDDRNASTTKNSLSCNVTWPVLKSTQIVGRYDISKDKDNIKDMYTSEVEATDVTATFSENIKQVLLLRASYKVTSKSNWGLKKIDEDTSEYGFDVNGYREYRTGITFNMLNYVKALKIITRTCDLSFDYSNRVTQAYLAIDEKPNWQFNMGYFDDYFHTYEPSVYEKNFTYSAANNMGLFGVVTAKLQYGYSIKEGFTTSGYVLTESKDWPNTTLTLASWDGIPFLEYLQKYMVSQSLSISYKETDNTSLSSNSKSTQTYNPAVIWNVSWKPKIRSEFKYSYYFTESSQELAESKTQKNIDSYAKVEYTTQLKKKMKSFLSDTEREIATMLTISETIRYFSSMNDNSPDLSYRKIENNVLGTYNFSNEMKLHGGLSYINYINDKPINDYNEFKFEVGFEILF